MVNKRTLSAVAKGFLPSKQQQNTKGGTQTMGWEEQCIDIYETPCITAGDPGVEVCQDPIKVGEECGPVWVDDPVEPEDPEPGGDPCDDPANFWMCNPDNPDPGDPSEPEEEEPDSKEDPCDKAKKMEKDTVQKAQLNDLKSKTSQNYEAGYHKTVGNTPQYSTGTPNTLSWNPPQMNTLSANSLENMSHSHYAATGSLSIFSGDDIDAFAKYVKFGKATNDFAFSVVTSHGTSYSLMIEDMTKFNSFYSTWINNTGESTILKSTLHNIYVKPSNSTAVNEANLLNFLQSNNSGIALLKANSDFSDWSSIKRDSNGNVVSDPCN